MSKRLDLVGQKFGRLTVIRFAGTNKRHEALWECLCDCGNKKIIVGDSIKRGNTKSCGCLYREMEEPIDLTGQKFGMLTVLKFVKKDKWDDPMYKCLCDCGKETIVRGSNLICGTTKSCGCLRKLIGKIMAVHNFKNPTTHGMSRTSIYSRWSSMIHRCYFPKCKSYKYYGARGISVCSRWKNSFENFYNDMMPGYDPSLQMDRIDNDGNYEPGNVRWVTPKVNNHNRRNSKHDSPKITPTSQLFKP